MPERGGPPARSLARLMMIIVIWKWSWWGPLTVPKREDRYRNARRAAENVIISRTFPLAHDDFHCLSGPNNGARMLARANLE